MNTKKITILALTVLLMLTLSTTISANNNQALNSISIPYFLLYNAGGQIQLEIDNIYFRTGYMYESFDFQIGVQNFFNIMFTQNKYWLKPEMSLGFNGDLDSTYFQAGFDIPLKGEESHFKDPYLNLSYRFSLEDESREVLVGIKF